MNFDEIKPRRSASADLGERGARLLRTDSGPTRADEVFLCAMDVITGLDPEGKYREGLEICGVGYAEIETAVEAILAGKNPEGSLPGSVIRYEVETAGEAATQEDRDRAFRCEGEAHAARHVLSLIGVDIEPRKQILL